MIVKCPYCEYAKPDQPLDLELLRKMHQPGVPTEDYMLFMMRQVELYGTKSYNGVKIHIGHKHKGNANEVFYKLNTEELAIINGGAR